MNSKHRVITLLGTAALLLTGACTATLAVAGQQANRPITQMIVRYKDGQTAVMSETGRAQAMAVRTGKALSFRRAMTTDTHVLALPDGGLSRDEALALARDLQADPNVLYAEPDDWVYPAAVITDPYYVGNSSVTRGQWHFKDPTTALLTPLPAGAGNFVGAWNNNITGSGVIVAVIDGGVAAHADLVGQVIAGYDFVSVAFIANDGDGRDADPTDPGDWVSQDDLSNSLCSNETVKPSSWHGTYLAGFIAALVNDAWGVGGAYGAKVLNVRALGKCGGYTSDIIDAMRWAVGLSVSGAPSNANRAGILNLSLGATGSCSSSFQSAVNDVRAAGAVVVAATGNDTSAVTQPANCTGVIAVTAHTYEGANASYANVGTETTLSAPGGGNCKLIGDCNYTALSSGHNDRYAWSTNNTGTSLAVDDLVWGIAGTSVAAPHVAAAAALLRGMRPELSPDEVKLYLTSTARPHPSGSYCAINPGLCGSGLLDASAAVAKLAGAPTLTATSSPSVVQAGSNTVVTLSGSATAQTGGSTSFTYIWSQESGPTALNFSTNGATASFTAPASGGVMVFRLSMTDGNGLVASAAVQVTATAPPSSGGGDLGLLGVVLLAAGWLVRRRS